MTARSASPSAALEETLLLFRILRLIPERGRTSAPEIHAALGRDGIELHRRTLERHLKTLREHPEIFPLDFDTTCRPFTIAWDERTAGLQLPPPSAGEAVALRIAQESLRRELPLSLTKGMKRLFRRMRANASEAGSVLPVAVVPERLEFTAPAVKPAVFERVSEALLEGRSLTLRVKSNGRLRSLTVSPLGLIGHASRLYLVGLFGTTRELTHLGLHRIELAALGDACVSPPEGFDLEDYARRPPFRVTYGRCVRLGLLTDDPEFVRFLKESPVNRTQSIRETETSTELEPRWEVRMEAEDTPLLDAWLARHQPSLLRVSKAPLPETDGNPAHADDLAPEAPVGSSDRP